MGLILLRREVWAFMLWPPHPPMHGEVISRLPPADTNQTQRSIIKLEILACKVELTGGGVIKCVCVCVTSVNKAHQLWGGGGVTYHMAHSAAAAITVQEQRGVYVKPD